MITALQKSAELKKSVKLKEHQKRVLKKMEDAPALLVYHGLGSGKTLASIAVGEKIPGKKKVIVPASLRENFRKELKKFIGDYKEYDIASYNKAVKEGIGDSDLVIMDEIQRVGGEGTKSSRLPSSIGDGKLIMLTGTPIRNRPNEFTPILAAIAKGRSHPKSRKEFDEMFLDQKKVYPNILRRIMGVKPGYKVSVKNKKLLKKMIEGRVDYHPAEGEYPSSEVIEIPTVMTKAQYRLYKGIQSKNPALRYKVRKGLPPNKTEAKQLNAFLAASRQVGNNPQSYDVNMKGDPVSFSPKMQAMVDSIMRRKKADKNFRGVVYSTYLGSGLIPIMNHLSEKGLRVKIFDGNLKDSDRKKVVADYNKGKIDVLHVSSAGSEGLDLKGTKLIQIMEPHWNQSRIDQVIGRTIRHKSHSALPKKDRHVVIEKYYSEVPQSTIGKFLSQRNIGADRYIKGLSDDKQRLIDEVLLIIQEEGLRAN